MKLTSEYSEHVHSGHRLALQQDGNVVAINFDADGFLLRGRGGLMRRLLEHRCEAEEFSLGGLVHDDFLMVLVNGGQPDRAGDHDVGLPAGTADFVNTLSRSKSLEFDLAGQDAGLFVVEQSK